MEENKDKDIKAAQEEMEAKEKTTPNEQDAETQPADTPKEEKADENEEELRITARAVEMLRTVFDPEIPVNVYDLGLIYKIDYDKSDKCLHVDMTLTAPHCPMADFIMEDVRQKLLSVEGPEKLDLRLVFEPEWNQDMMSEEAKLELGYL